MRRNEWIIVAAVGMLGTALLGGCGNTTNSTTTNVQSTNSGFSAAQNPLNAKDLLQFENDFIEIPIAPYSGATATSQNFTVTLKQYTDWDFGLRAFNRLTGMVERPMNPVTGMPIKTPTWYYDINGAGLGIYGATVEVQSGVTATFTYVNDLRDANGQLLTKHVIAIDPSIDGMSMGEPEVRMVTHLHGGHVDWRYDGHPEAWVTNIPASQQTAVSYGLAADPVRGFPGRPSDNKFTYRYPNDQEASTLWFHDHTLGITRLHAYAGVAAVYVIRDALDSGTTNTYGFPAGPLAANPVVPSLKSYKYDLPVVLQDKSFTADGSLVFPTYPNLGAYAYTVLRDRNGDPTQTLRPEMFGTVNVVNGKAWPKKTVERTGYRFRFVNGADSRVYNLWMEDADTGEIITEAMALASAPTRSWPIVQVAAEQGLFPRAVPVMTGSRNRGLALGTGERADVIIDFSHPVFMNGSVGRRLILRNDAPAPFGGLFGPENDDMSTLDPVTTGKVMLFVVSGPGGTSYDARIKGWMAALGTAPALPAPPSDKIRYIDLQERKDSAFAFFDPLSGLAFNRMQLLINGLRFSDPITEKVSQDDVEDWIFINTTPDMHPLHLHLVKFQVVEKGHVNIDGSTVTYIPADGAGSMPAPVCVAVNTPAGCYSSLHPNNEPRSTNSAGNSTGLLTPDTSDNSLFARSGNEIGWKDTVKVPPAEISYDPNGAVEVVNPGYVRLRAKFDLPAGADKPTGGAVYMYHCHILSHEEHEMMRPFAVE